MESAKTLDTDDSFVPVYKGHEFEAIKLQFETQTSLLRTLTDVDLRVFTGYITLQLLLGGWLAVNPVKDFGLKIGILLVDLVLTFIAGVLLYNSYQRRSEVSDTLKNLNDALGYTQKDVYLQDRAINAKTTFRAWVHAYQLGLVVGYIGILILVFAVP